MKAIGVVLPDRSASGLCRAILPVRACREMLAADGIDLRLLSDVSLGDRLDAIVIHRAIARKAQEFVAKLKNRGTRVAWDNDDDLGNVAPWNPIYGDPMVPQLWAETAALADESWASTATLGHLTGATRVLPNMVDPAMFACGPLPPKSPDARVSVLWAGGSSHRGDLEAVEDALDAVLTDYRDRVTVALFGGTFPGKLMAKWYGLGLQLLDPVPLADYYRTLRRLQPDIGICPLADHPFNASKSNVKFLEYTLAGAATVASDGPAYAGCAAALARSPAEWAATLASLIDDPVARRALAAGARQQVAADYTVAGGAAVAAWLEAFRGLVA